MLGSGIMTNQRARIAHLVRLGKGGVAGEVADLRQDIIDDFAASAALAIEEFSAPAAADTDAILAPVQSKNAEAALYVAADLVGGAAVALDPPRNVTVTTDAGGTPGESPSEATVTGKDINGDAISEVIPLSQAAGTDVGAKAFALVESVAFKDDGTGTGAQLEVGFGTIIGLGKKIKDRANDQLMMLVEIDNGSTWLVGGAVTATLAPPHVGEPNGTVDPTTPPAGADYVYIYEFDPTA
jgi:hypothetical protein